MANFNDTGLGIPQIPMTETTTKKTLKMESESGYLRTRSRSVRAFKKFGLKYVNITSTQYQSLIDFFNDNSGNAFVWEHPITNVNYNVTFEDDDIQVDHIGMSRLNVNINLREVW